MITYFFDLDGTLTDSRPGLYVSFQAALKAIGAEASEASLHAFLGTPLPEMFRSFRADISQDEIERGIQAFRVTYERVGITQNRLYRGIRGMLETIRDRGQASWVVTSKPEFYATKVVSLLGLDDVVAGVVGAGTDETDTKTDLIDRALTLADTTSDAVVMVGDRHYDIVGALANHVTPIGVLWGYGSYDELHAAGCRYFARSVEEFQSHFVDEAVGKPGHGHGRMPRLKVA